MRLVNIVVGLLLAVALAYAHDVSVPATSADGQPQQIVNWDVLGHSVRGVGAWVQDQLETLAAQLHGRN